MDSSDKPMEPMDSSDEPMEPMDSSDGPMEPMDSSDEPMQPPASEQTLHSDLEIYYSSSAFGERGASEPESAVATNSTAFLLPEIAQQRASFQLILKNQGQMREMLEGVRKNQVVLPPCPPLMRGGVMLPEQRQEQAPYHEEDVEEIPENAAAHDEPRQQPEQGEWGTQGQRWVWVRINQVVLPPCPTLMRGGVKLPEQRQEQAPYHEEEVEEIPENAAAHDEPRQQPEQGEWGTQGQRWVWVRTNQVVLPPCPTLMRGGVKLPEQRQEQAPYHEEDVEEIPENAAAHDEPRQQQEQGEWGTQGQRWVWVRTNQVVLPPCPTLMRGGVKLPEQRQEQAPYHEADVEEIPENAAAHDEPRQQPEQGELGTQGQRWVWVRTNQVVLPPCPTLTRGGVKLPQQRQEQAPYHEEDVEEIPENAAAHDEPRQKPEQGEWGTQGQRWVWVRTNQVVLPPCPTLMRGGVKLPEQRQEQAPYHEEDVEEIPENAAAHDEPRQQPEQGEWGTQGQRLVWVRTNQVVLPPCPTLMRGGVKLPEQRQEQAPYHEEDVEEIPVNVAAHDEPRQQPEQGEWGTQGQRWVWVRTNQVVLPPCPTLMRGGVKLPEQRQEQAPYHEEDVEEIPENAAAHDEPRQQPEQGEWGTQGQRLVWVRTNQVVLPPCPTLMRGGVKLPEQRQEQAPYHEEDVEEIPVNVAAHDEPRQQPEQGEWGTQGQRWVWVRTNQVVLPPCPTLMRGGVKLPEQRQEQAPYHEEDVEEIPENAAAHDEPRQQPEQGEWGTQGQRLVWVRTNQVVLPPCPTLMRGGVKLPEQRQEQAPYHEEDVEEIPVNVAAHDEPRQQPEQGEWGTQGQRWVVLPPCPPLMRGGVKLPEQRQEQAPYHEEDVEEIPENAAAHDEPRQQPEQGEWGTQGQRWVWVRTNQVVLPPCPTLMRGGVKLPEQRQEQAPYHEEDVEEIPVNVAAHDEPRQQPEQGEWGTQGQRWVWVRTNQVVLPPCPTLMRGGVKLPEQRQEQAPYHEEDVEEIPENAAAHDEPRQQPEQGEWGTQGQRLVWVRTNQVVLPPCPTLMRDGVKLPEQRQEQAPYHEEDVEEIPVNVAAHDEPRQQPEQGEWGTQGQLLSEKLSDELRKFFETTHCILDSFCFEDYERVKNLATLLKRAGMGVSSSDSPMEEVVEAYKATKKLIVAANGDIEINDPGLVIDLSERYGKCPVVDVRWFLTVLAARDLRVMRLHVISDTRDEDFAERGFPRSVYSVDVQGSEQGQEDGGYNKTID